MTEEKLKFSRIQRGPGRGGVPALGEKYRSRKSWMPRSSGGGNIRRKITIFSYTHVGL